MQVESTKDVSSTKKNKQIGSPQRRRGRIVVFKKPLTDTVFTLLLCLLLCCFHVYGFQPSSTIMSQRFYRQWLKEATAFTKNGGASNTSLQQQRHGRTLSSLRLFSSSVATTSVGAATTTTSIKKANTDTVVELKYMEYLPHDSSSAQAHHNVPIVFLHGLLGNKKNFATIATSLGNQLKKKRRIIGLDLRNHGDNHHDWRESMNYFEMAQDLLAFLDTHNIPKAVLVGHSMGGKVAQAVALTEPSRVDGLVVLDIAPVAYSNDEPHWKAVQDIVTVLATIPVGPGVTRRDVDIQLRSTIPDPALRAFCLTNFDATKGQWKIHIQAICAQLDEIASFDIGSPTTLPLPLNNGQGMDNNNNAASNQEQQQQTQQQYPGDAFFIHGGQSRFVRHAYIPAIQSYFPNHMLTTMRGAGHWIHAEKPEDTIALLKRFLER